MGSSYFYLEFLLSWLSVLSAAGYGNPAIFALDYTLVPDATFPTQLREAAKAYEHVVSFARDSSKVVVSGDSAGATIILSLLLHLAKPTQDPRTNGLMVSRLKTPAMAVLISPWVTLQSRRYKSTTSDYLDAKTLASYAVQYAGVKDASVGGTCQAVQDPLISPGDCKDANWWRKAAPTSGFCITYGEEEVFAPEVKSFVERLQKADVEVESRGEQSGIHAWPVASLFLCNSIDERLKGLRLIVDSIRLRIPPSKEQMRNLAMSD